MSKIFIKRKKLNENITITDPTLAQQFLAVKKQMVDKKTKRDQLVKNVNQIDAELNILDKNLLAIETKSAQQTGKVSVQKPENQEKIEGQGGEIIESLDEKISDIFVPKTEDELPTLDEYREMVISSIDDIFNDGETLVYEYEGILSRCFERQQSPNYCATLIIDDNLCDLGYNVVTDYHPEIEDIDDSYIGGDTMGKIAANQSTPIRVHEGIQYKKGMCIEVNGREIINISKIEEYPKFNLVYYKDDLDEEKIFNSNWLDEQNVEIVSEPKKYRSPAQLEKIQDTLMDQIRELEDELQYVNQEKKNIEIDMEEDLANYDELTHVPEKNPRYSLDNKEKIYSEMPHDIYGGRLNDVDTKIEEIENKLTKLYQHSDCPYHHSEYSKSKSGYSSITPEEFNNLGVKESVNESIYEDIIDDLESEKEKMVKIQDFIHQTTQNIDIDVNLPDEIEDKPQEEPEVLIPVEEEPEDIESISEPPPFDLVHYEKEHEHIESPDIPEGPFELSPDEVLTNETLKVEDNKESYIPELVEAEDIETEIEMMNYEEDDQFQDEYVFHVRIDGETDHEIVAKIFRDYEDDFWTVRVVKGDEEPLQSMEFDPRLDKLEIIGKVADIYDDIEIIDPKEYEYLLDDKEKIDKEYYSDLVKEGIKDILKPKSEEEIKDALENSNLSLSVLLTKSSESGFLLGVKKALEMGADVHWNNDSPLRWASMNGHYDTVELLLKNGADVHADNDYALQWASRRGHYKVIELLLKHGADVDERSL